METLRGKHIVLAVTAGIAIYKAVDLVSRLRKEGAEVRVVMTEHATHLVSPILFAEISGNPVALDMWDEHVERDVKHIGLASWADAYIIAPATANIIAKAAQGIADDMVSTSFLATYKPKFVCPAMNTHMYENPATQANLEILRERGIAVLEPASGKLACGTTGVGRLPEPAEILEWLQFGLCRKDTLRGRRVVVTAGGTAEPIDPVRVITNRSSGKMGYAIARQAALAGAETTLITAPTHLKAPYGVEVVQVGSALEMQAEVEKRYERTDIVLMAAAVSDYRAAAPADQKIKKMKTMELALTRNPDILLELGQQKRHQLLVGFAAETENIIEFARKKLVTKNVDLLVVNDVSKKDRGFDVDTNEGTLIYQDGHTEDFPNMSKDEVGALLMSKVEELLQKR